MSKKASAPVSVGGLSVIMVFVTLCMTTFGVLSLTSAVADKKLTEKNAQSVADYYVCEGETQQLLGEISMMDSAESMNTLENVSAVIKDGVIYATITVAKGDMIGVTMTVAFQDGKVTVLNHRMYSQHEFVLGDGSETAWQP